MISTSQTVNSAVNPNLPYDLTRDFAAITQMSSLFFVLYHHPSLAVKSVKELIAHDKAQPGKVNYGTAGAGSSQHIGVEMFSFMSGIKLTHVPYKGGAGVVTAMLAGVIQIAMTSLPPVQPHIHSGRIRALAITAKQRSSVVPELPTIAEAGVPGYELNQWEGIITGAKVPPAIIRKLNAGIADALKSRDVLQRMSANGSTTAGSSPEAFDAHIKSEIAKWRKLVKDAGLVLQ